MLFTGYLTLSGAVSTSADALTVQATRSAVGAMPVVGRILSDAAGSVLAGAGVVKNAIGVFGLLGCWRRVWDPLYVWGCSIFCIS